ncbi:NADH dehydrogenase [ubiquinone] 1 alpha subcomplex assembly factor 3 [Epargyreus clarus]|uniref:NADH dehydrogenase [ubiquinone] 1 alpha subcomplex assembly factor 3 n=1 Tax=Epargyreus clarus TaxID=520877 RepID=UPI003C2FDCB8
MIANKIRQISFVGRSPQILSARHKARAAYDGDGKTTVRVINQETDLGLMIDTYATYGFRLNNGISVLGSMAIFPRAVLSWQVRNSDDITEGALRLFKILEPKIDLLIIGLESNEPKTLNRVFRLAKQAQLNIELLQTERACSTFNFLNAEGRSVAGAFIPPLNIAMNEDDMLATKLHHQNLYENTH